MTRSAASPRIAEPPSSGDPSSGESADEGVRLLDAIRAVPATLRGLFEHEHLFDATALAQVQSTLESVERRLGRKELQVVVTGERRSGKSTLLDAIVGDRLLGGARGQLDVVTFLRRSDVPGYRARFASGVVDDFSERVPDVAATLDIAAQKLDDELREAQRRCHAARLELERANQTREQAELEAEKAMGRVQAARDLASGASSELLAAENDSTRIERTLAALEPRVPASLRSPRPRWAWWWWAWFALFVLFRRELWRRYQALVHERGRVRMRLSLERERAAEAMDARGLAEVRFQPLDVGAERARSESQGLVQALEQADTERARLRSEREDLRSEREHRVSERWRRFFTDLQALSKKADLVELSIDYPAKLLPDDVTIVDIPGMVLETSQQWAVIREQADGCILVSELDRAVSEWTKRFLRQLRDVVPHVLLVLTKMDQAYDRMLERGEEDPWGQVEHARSIGTRRFARELGRAPNSVLSVSVAAEALLSDRRSELATRSESELNKLFVLLRRERALILGAHAAGAIRRCIASLGDAEVRAERGYRERILELERKRTPEPAVFRQKLLEDAEPATRERAHQAVLAATDTLRDGFRLLERLCEQTLDSPPKKRDLVERASVLATELSLGSATAHGDARVALEAGIQRGVTSIEPALFQALRARYQLLHEVGSTTSSSPRLVASTHEAPSFAGIIPEVRAAVKRFTHARYALSVAGMLTGAAGGVTLHPWWGPLAGGALGGLTALLHRERALRDDTLRRFHTALDARRQAYAEELAALEPEVTEAIRLAIEGSLERAMIRFARWIAEPLEAERQLIESEREKLAELEGLRDKLGEHDRELERLLDAARRASVGLCRASAR